MAMTALEELQKYNDELRLAYNLKGELYFKVLKGGVCNAPVYVYQSDNGVEKPIGVLKRELEEHRIACARFKIIDEVEVKGFTRHPKIYKNKDGDHLSKIGGSYYSFIQYIKPDNVDPENAVDFAHMLKLTEDRHLYFHALGDQPALASSRYQQHLARESIIDHLDTIGLSSSFFETKHWKRFHSLYLYYRSSHAKSIFASLPQQVIHGDNHQGNLILHDGEAYFIDFDPMRYDLRLFDLTSIVRHGEGKMFQQYMQLAISGKLFDFIEQHYGQSSMPLSAEERQHFHLVVAFSYVEFVSWALNEIKQSVKDGDLKRTSHLANLVDDRIQSVLQLFDNQLLVESDYHSAKSMNGFFAKGACDVGSDDKCIDRLPRVQI